MIRSLLPSCFHALAFTDDQIRDAILQIGYEEATTTVTNGVHVTTYEEPHELEQMRVEEGEDGIAVHRLFKQGILQLMWNKLYGEVMGDFVVYCGKALFTQEWKNFLSNDDQRRIENEKTGLILHIYDILSKRLIYKGAYNKKRERNGCGFVYDRENGKCLYYGFFLNDALQSKIQTFVDDNTMVEFEGDETYRGGYVYLESERRCVRHGHGIVISNGKAPVESDWVYGVQKSSDQTLMYKFLSSLSTITSLSIGSSAYNEFAFTSLLLKSIPSLTSITIADGSFVHVEEVVIEDLPQLQTLTIGRNSFTHAANGCAQNASRHFSLRNCCQLHEIVIGAFSFSDYSSFSLHDLERLETLSVGSVGSPSSCFAYSSFCLEGVD